MTANADPLAEVREARHRLDELAAALARVDLETLLASDAHLEDATLALSRVNAGLLPPGPEVRAVIEDARRALARCRRLGASLADVIRVAGAAHGAAWMSDSYDRGGHATGAVNRHALETQV
jgi:hypothetical protein